MSRQDLLRVASQESHQAKPERRGVQRDGPGDGPAQQRPHAMAAQHGELRVSAAVREEQFLAAHRAAVLECEQECPPGDVEHRRDPRLPHSHGDSLFAHQL
jgi:hypothetical protein